MNPIPYPSEADERKRLDHVKALVEAELGRVTSQVLLKNAEAREIKKFIQEHKADMDHAEKVSTRNSADQVTALTEHSEKHRRILERLARSPYFGRIDFQPMGESGADPVYIGIHSFRDEDTGTHLVHDWRAPISSMFYHHETGLAAFEAPEGRIEGEILRKRQYKIENGRLEFMLETELNIHDDLLQRELSQASDDRMRNIVATIQRDQNAIIRNDDTQALIIQGAAGSGKTSIALHRIAYLLYRYKDTLRSEDILIISPNNVFAHYISRVLPELGEEMIRETTMEGLAGRLLGPKLHFQSFADQVALLLKHDDEPYAERIRFKSSPAFLEKLDEYARLLRRHNVRAVPVDLGYRKVPAEWIEAQFQRSSGLPFAKQVVEVTDAVVERIKDHYGIRIAGSRRSEVRTQLQAMLRHADIESAYAGFYDFLAEPTMLVRGKKGAYEYADVFPLIYLKLLIEGLPVQHEVRHLVIDEMQDYSVVQYRVLAKIFPCRKTVLGDADQSVNPISSTSSAVIEKILPDAGCVTMNKSYRSTVQITRLALRIKPNPDIVPVERHGEEPEIAACADEKSEIQRIRDWICDFAASGRHSLGIVCKTQPQAAVLFKRLSDAHEGIVLLDAKSTVFGGGVTVATAHFVKGLEFDEVIVPHANDANFRSEIDRQMLYVACTRAMHRLRLSHVGELTRFLR